ncbi:hypothetical protein GF373_06410 [bacterium]|nr:hypothetical protein [bacterium]
MNSQTFIENVKHEDKAKKLEAWHAADKQNADVIPQLAALIKQENTALEKCVTECLQKIVHSVGKTPGGKKRQAITKELIGLIDKKNMWVSKLAFRYLSWVAENDSIPKLKKYLTDADLYEEAAYCFERIPSQEANRAMLDALKQAKGKDQKLRLIIALGHQRENDAVETLSKLMQSADKEIALTALESLAKIGQKPQGDACPTKFKNLSDVEQQMRDDSILLLCDALIERRENVELAESMLKTMLDKHPEEHMKCGAIISLGNLDKISAVKNIIGMLAYEPSFIVRDTAQKTLTAMKGQSADPALSEALQSVSGEQKKTLQAIVDARKLL